MKITQIKSCVNLPDSLRKIAHDLENGDLEADCCTMILGTDIFQLGIFDDNLSAVNAIWDMTYGIHKLMSEALKAE